jgi:hypothetical protein
MRTTRGTWAALTLLVAMVIGGTAWAQESVPTWWQHDPNEPGWWIIPENWTAGVPTAETYAFIDNGGTAEIHWTDVGWIAAARSLTLGGHRSGTVSHQGGALEISETLWVGQYSSGGGRYLLSDGRLSVRDVLVSSGWRFGPLLPVEPLPGGYIRQSGGRCDVGGTLRVGYETPIDSWADVPATGAGAGEAEFTDDDYADAVRWPQALYVLGGGELTAGRTEVGIGGAGRFIQRGGLHAVDGSLCIGGRMYWPIAGVNADAAVGPDGELTWPYPLPRDAHYAMQGGELRAGRIEIDAGPRPWPWGYPINDALVAPDPSLCPPMVPGSLVQTGGDVVVQGAVSINGGFNAWCAEDGTCPPPSWANAERWWCGEGSYLLENGSLTARTILVGQRGRARFVQTGGASQIEGTLQIGGNRWWWDGSTIPADTTADAADLTSVVPPNCCPLPHGTYVLSEGELATGQTEVGVGGVGRFVQTGGTQKVAGVLRVGGGPYWPIALTDSTQPDGAVTEILPPYPGPSKGSYEMIDGRLQAARIEVGAGYTPLAWPWDYEPTDATLPEIARPVAPWGWGVFRQTGGEVTVDGCVDIRGGRYEMADGSLSARCLTVGGQYWYDHSRFVQTGGVVDVGEVHLGSLNAYLGRPTVDADVVAATEFAPYPGAETYALVSGRLKAKRIGLGGMGRSMLVQTGGALTVGRLEVQAGRGTYAIARGSVQAGVMQIGRPVNSVEPNAATNWLRIGGREAQITVTDQLVFGADAGLCAVPGSRITMFGADHRNYSTDPIAFRGMDNLRMIFSIGPEDDLEWEKYEVAGRDLGFVRKGFVGNFVLETLQVGGEIDVGELQLMDEFDNQPDWDGAEALYVRHLIVGPGSRLDLNGLNLYYLRGDIADPGSIFGGTLEWVSSPEWLIPGDYNLDGAVTDADYTVWADNYGTSGATIDMGDANGDGAVTDSDYTVWADNYGTAEPSAGVPEPATVSLLAMLGGIGLLRRRAR